MLNLKKNIVIPITLVIIALGSLWYFLGEHEGIPDVKHQATSEQKGDDSDLVEQKKYALNKAVDSIDGKNDSDSGFKSENNHISSIDRVDSIFDNHKLLLELAREGDSLSQYRLYKMLAQCEWDFKPSEYDVESAIDRLVLNGYDPEQGFADDMRARAESCRPLYDIYEGKAMYEVRNAWLAESASNGNVFALLKFASTEPDRFAEESYSNQFKLWVKEAFEFSQKDQFMLHEAIDNLITYVAMKPNSVEKELGQLHLDEIFLGLAKCRSQKFATNCEQHIRNYHESSAFYSLDPELENTTRRADSWLIDITTMDLSSFDPDNF